MGPIPGAEDLRATADWSPPMSDPAPPVAPAVADPATDPDTPAARRAAAAESMRAREAFATPESLPIATLRDELLATIRDHQVVVVAGETGSGKSTQLPKLCLELGRGVHGLIGHTQPRRVAARTIAERVADELGTTIGEHVGYTVRFTDKVGPSTLVKVMTDGILLAEIQRDRMLRRYDTIIIDEAHERSLNVDFLLGYLKQLLPKRPDLKVIVTSATIDTARFSAHFDGAPVVEVSGRGYPVEVRYRPLDAETDQVQGICDAVAELSAEGPGDILVFLSGEREIHDAADALRRADLRHTEVLPLYARLSAAEQHRIFQSHTGRRVVLSTNVAETSLTVPGVRYVIDTGVARMSRYSHRLKVQRLPIEPISQASSNQRAGRCGRVAPGICIRLFDEDDFAERPAFTEPEILRTNLASVILQMTALGLGDVGAFPFVEPPDRRAVRDGYALLDELGALQPTDGPIDARRRLTSVGKRLARLPIDPRLGRMVLEADRLGCVHDVLVIATALSIQDPRERPAEARQAADELHRRFHVPGSDFLAWVKLWEHLRTEQQRLSSNQFRRLCRAEHLNYLRVREWQDLFSQVRQVAGELGIRGGAQGAHPDKVHQALLAGLLSHLGMRDGTTRDFRGARGSRFSIGAGSALAAKPPRWLMAAELVETNRLWARSVAAIQPEWAERLGGSLVRYTYEDPVWEARNGRATVIERATLYGLPVVTGRTIGLDRLDPELARELFIRHALVEGDWETHLTLVAENRAVFDELRSVGDRVRRFDLVDDEALFTFYDRRVGADVVSGRHFERWWNSTRGTQPELMRVTAADLLGDAAGDEVTEEFPDTWHYDGIDLGLTYRYEPGAPDDGATVHVPLTVLNRVGPEGFDWNVPGLREELVGALCRTLPVEIRRLMVPAAETVRAVCSRLDPDDGTLVVAVARALTERVGERVAPAQFDTTRVPDHLRMTFAVDDAAGTCIGRGKDLPALQRELGPRLRAAIAAAVPLAERTGITTWDVGTVPQVVRAQRDGHLVIGYPALLDDGDSVSLRVFTGPDVQHRVMRAGVRRLLLLGGPVARKQVVAALSTEQRLSVARSARVELDELVDDSIVAAVDEVIAAELDAGRGLPWDAAGFAGLQAAVRAAAGSTAVAAVRAAADVLVAAADVERRLDRLGAPALVASVDDARHHLQRLVQRRLVVTAGVRRLPDVVRYVRGIERRLDKLADAPQKDLQRMRTVGTLEAQYRELLGRYRTGPVPAEVVELGWQLEELRVAEFAQTLGVKGSVSVQRIARQLAVLSRGG
jgi:ATP-dependent helicase HrpA